MAELAELLKKHNLSAKRSWGQHFLADKNILSAIVKAIEKKPPLRVVELGGGAGTLTKALSGVGYSVTVVERDRGFVTLLEAEFAQDDKVSVVADDAKRINLASLLPGEKTIVVGNLPYNIASPIIFNLLKQRAQISQMVFMLQYEMAMRVVAKPRSKDYSALSVFLQIYTAPKLVKKVSASSFIPPPKVNSAIVAMAMKNIELSPPLEKSLFILVNAAFSQRRKQLKNSLSAVIENAGEFLKENAVSPSARAEELAPLQYLKLAEKLAAIQRLTTP